MTLSAVIVDDELQNIEVLKKMILKFCTGINVVGTAGTISDARKIVDELNPDIVFLDVELPGENGFELIESLEEINFHVIFTTAHADYAVKAIKFAALDYLLKPISVQELRDAVEKAKSEITKSKNKEDYNDPKLSVLKDNVHTGKVELKRIALPTSEGLELYDLADVIYVEADRSYCKFFMVNNKKIVVSKAMKEFEEILTSANFIRVHKSSMVNLSHVTKYIRGKGGALVMSDGSLVNIAVRKKELVMKYLNESAG